MNNTFIPTINAVEIGSDRVAAAPLTRPKWLAGKSSLSLIDTSHAPNKFRPTLPGA